jgi:hypothetical protein
LLAACRGSTIVARSVARRARSIEDQASSCVAPGAPTRARTEGVEGLSHPPPSSPHTHPHPPDSNTTTVLPRRPGGLCVARETRRP